MTHLDAISQPNGGKACVETVSIPMSTRELALASEALTDANRLDKAERKRELLAAAILAYPHKTLRQLIDLLP